MNIHQLFLRGSIATFVTALAFTAMTPMSALAATSSSASAFASIAPTSLNVVSGGRAYLTGTTTDAVRKVRVIITASSSSSELFKSSTITVSSRGTWTSRVTKTLKDGTYKVSVYDASSSHSKLLTTGTLNVGVRPSTLSVSSIPLLWGGVVAPGSTVPISYLQVINQSVATTSIAGFYVREDGSAPAASLAGLSSVDDQGASYSMITAPDGNLLFTNGQAFVPSTAVLAPGQRKLFTLKAQMSALSGRFAGTPLMLNVVGLQTAAAVRATFPIVGTTWSLSAF